MSPSAIAIQTWAMLVDAYRELSNRRLFWITLVISGFVAAAFAAVGITEKGITILHWEFDTPFMTTKVMAPEAFYKMLFTQLGVGTWLGWIASILALVSTASIFPDFLTGGAVDLWLSKPIGRLRLFLTKFIFGLLFVALQVAVFTGASFLVLGLRGGAWVPGVFLAVPLVVCFFSYLFAFCVLFGVLTRSTIAALLLTLLVWFGLFLVNSAESTLMTISTIPTVQIEQAEKRLEVQRKRAEPNEERIKQLEADIAKSKESGGTLAWWHDWSVRVKTVLPKTDETVELLQRRLLAITDMPGGADDALDDEQIDEMPFGNRDPVSQRELQRRVIEERRQRSAWWILGTSLAFELVILGIAAFVFCRRDY